MSNVVYHTPILPEHRGNPFIEALPPKKDFSDIVEALACFPPCLPEERDLPAFEREEYLSRIKQLRLPLPDYKNCFRFIYRALVDSYSSRSPFSPTTNHYLHYLDPDTAPVIPDTGVFEPRGTAITILGRSGIGKTKMLLQVLKYFPQVIDHTTYRGKPFQVKQMVWAYVEIPGDATRRAICHAILRAIDQALGVPPTQPARTIDTLVDQIEHRIRFANLGLLALDEIQNIDQAKAGGLDGVVKFLLSLINRSGVPLVLSGNPDVAELLRAKFRVARRTEEGGFMRMGRISPNFWPTMIGALWRMQWTSPPTELTAELSKRLYELSAGVLGIAVNTFREAQALVIGSGDERITVEVLNAAHIRACPLTERELAQIRALDDMDCRVAENDGLQAKTCPDSEASSSSHRATIIPGDVMRPQHPEFSSKIRKLHFATLMTESISELHLIRDLADSDDKLQDLREASLMIVNPLRELAELSKEEVSTVLSGQKKLG